MMWLQGKMAQDMTEKELLKMELDQLKKEVKNERQMVSFSPKTRRGCSPG